MSTLLVHNSINSCIHIEQKRISRRRTIPEYINFELNQDTVSQIIALKNNRHNFFVSEDNLAELRYFFLLNSSNKLGLGITFKTYYERQEEKVAIIKSVIDLSGKAEQYIRSDALDSKEIIDSHYWLIEQIFNQIPLRYKKKKLSRFIILLGLVFFLLIVIIVLLIPLVLWAKVLLLFFLMAIILKTLPSLLEKYLYSWVLHQLLFGFFSYSLKRKKIGFNLLEIICN